MNPCRISGFVDRVRLDGANSKANPFALSVAKVQVPGLRTTNRNSQLQTRLTGVANGYELVGGFDASYKRRGDVCRLIHPVLQPVLQAGRIVIVPLLYPY